MKRLRHPLMVGVLAAVAVISWRLLWPMVKPSHALSHRMPPPLPVSQATASQPGDRSTNAATNLLPTPAAPIDRDYAKTHFREWLEAPRRDPFLFYASRKDRGSDRRAAADLLSLNAIWRQTGCRLATVNRQVVGEGDTVAGFTVERIEQDAVWVRGTQGVERVSFRTPAAESRTPAAGSNAHGLADAPFTTQRAANP